MALFVLGAGATRGASFVKPADNPCLPPLDLDFYAQLQRIKNVKHQKTVRDVIKDTVELFGVNFQVTMETVFTTLEHTARMIETTGENRDFKRSDLDAKKERLMQAIAATKSVDDAKLAEHLRKNTFKTIVGDISFGKNGEWAKSRIFQAQFRGIKGNGVDQFKNVDTLAIITPTEYKSADVIYPFEKARQ